MNKKLTKIEWNKYVWEKCKDVFYTILFISLLIYVIMAIILFTKMLICGEVIWS